MKKLFLALCVMATVPLICRADGNIIGGSNPPGILTISPSSIPGGATSYIQLTNSLQTGATFYTSSGTVNTFNVGTNLNFSDGSRETTAGWYVVRSTFTTATSSATSTTGATWFPTNISLSITPKKTTDVVELKFNGLMLESAVGAFCDLNIFAGTGRLLLGTNGQATINNTSATGTYGPFPLLAYDNPLTTSATTYTVAARNSGSSGTCTLTPSSYQSVFSAVIQGN